MERNRSSRLFAPTAPSIARTSSGVWGWYRKAALRLLLLLDERAVGLRVHERLELLRIGRLDDDHPALLVRIVVDRLGRVAERIVHLDDLAGHRREELRDGLRRLDDAERLALLHGVAHVRHLDVDHVAEQYKVPLVIPSAAKEEITRQGYKWVFRVNAPAHVYAQSLIDAALTLGKPKSIAFVYESTDFGNSVSKAGKDYAAAKGLAVVADEAYQKGAPDYRSTLTKVKEKNPDLVFMVSYVADAILLMRQSRELGLKPQAFLGGGAGFDTTQFESERAISENVLSVTQWTPDSGPGAEDFAARYEKKYGKPPTYHAACTYTSMMVVGAAIKAAGGDRNKIREALASGGWTTIMG